MTLELTTLKDDDDWYCLRHEYFTDANGRFWRNDGEIGERPMRPVLCFDDGIPKNPVWNHVHAVKVDGVEVPFLKFDTDAWKWEDDND